MEALFLSGCVNDAFEWQVNDADIGRASSVALGSGFTERNGFGMQENRQNGMLVSKPISRRVDLPWKTFVARNAVGGSEVACF